MESVQFNSFLEKSTSGRYGDVDTSITILNSANNSSKGSTPSRGSSKVELLKKESKDEKD